MKHYLATIRYFGQNYYGWQKQSNAVTVQETLERAVSVVANTSIVDIVGCSRTDRGVHALGQVCKISIPRNHPNEEFMTGLNAILPFDIRVLKIERTNPGFKIVYFAKKKTYLYFFTNREAADDNPYFTNFSEKIDLEKIEKGVKLFLGEHDFANFSYRNEKKDRIRTIYSCDLLRGEKFGLDEYLPDDVYCLRFEGSGFLRNMVRIMVGTLINLGQGKTAESEISSAFELIDTDVKTGYITPPQGLWLQEITF